MRDWLIAMRMEKGLSQKACAREIGVAKQAYANAEHGTLTREKTLIKVAAYFGFDVSRFGIKPVEKQPRPRKARGNVSERKRTFETEICADERRIFDRAGKLKCFHPMFTVHSDGTVDGSYWDALERIEYRR